MSATTTQTVAVNTSVKQKSEAAEAGTWFTRQQIAFERGRFGWMSLLLTFQSCLGAVACMYILENDSLFQLSVCSIVTMTCNAILIAQAPGKWCLLSFYISIFVNTLMIVYNLV